MEKLHLFYSYYLKKYAKSKVHLITDILTKSNLLIPSARALLAFARQ